MPNWKDREIFSRLNVPEDSPVIIRVDGWNFRKITEKIGLKRPYDTRLAKSLAEASSELMRMGFPIAFAFTFSDEISFLLAPPLPWRGRIEKLITILASYTSGYLSKVFDEALAFDGRVVFVRNEDEIVDYMRWRQSEAWRNALNSYALKALENQGLSRKDAVEALKGKKSSELHDLIFKNLGVNVNDVPAWQRRGIMIRWIIKIKNSNFGPVQRRSVRVDWDLPLFSTPEGRDYLLESISIGMSSFRGMMSSSEG